MCDNTVIYDNICHFEYLFVYSSTYYMDLVEPEINETEIVTKYTNAVNFILVP